MSNLRKVPPPKPKEANWVEEYRKERSVSPMPPTNQSTQETQQPEPAKEFNVQTFNKPTYDKVDSPINTNQQQPFLARQASLKESQNHQTDQNNNFSTNNNFGSTFNPNSPTQRVYSPFASSPQPNLPKPLSPVKLNQDENVPIYVRSSQRATSPKPPTPQFEQAQSSPVSTFQRQPSLEQSQTPIYVRTPRNVSASPVKQLNQSTFNQANTNDTENYPIYVRSFQKQQAPAAPSSTPSYAPSSAQNVQSPANTQQQPLSTAQRFINEPGRQYQQPNRAANQSNNTQSTPSLANQQMPPWMRRTNSKEIPEWANQNDDLNRSSQSNQQTTSTFTPNSNYSTNNSTTQYGNNYSTASKVINLDLFFKYVL